MTRTYMIPRVIVGLAMLTALVLQVIPAMRTTPPFVNGSHVLGIAITVAVGIALLALVAAVFRPAPIDGREFRDASIGVGTLVSSRATGASANDHPQLELVFDVETADGETIRGATTEYINIASLAHLVPGAVVPVAYTATGRIALAPDTQVEKMADVVYASRVKTGKLTEHQLRVAKDGLPPRPW